MARAQKLGVGVRIQWYKEVNRFLKTRVVKLWPAVQIRLTTYFGNARKLRIVLNVLND